MRFWPIAPAAVIVVMSQLSPTLRGQTITSFASGCADCGRVATAGVVGDGDGDGALAIVGTGIGTGVGSERFRDSTMPPVTASATTTPLPMASARRRPEPPVERRRAGLLGAPRGGSGAGRRPRAGASRATGRVAEAGGRRCRARTGAAGR